MAAIVRIPQALIGDDPGLALASAVRVALLWSK
jgi:hypothetical protein